MPNFQQSGLTSITTITNQKAQLSATALNRTFNPGMYAENVGSSVPEQLSA